MICGHGMPPLQNGTVSIRAVTKMLLRVVAVALLRTSLVDVTTTSRILVAFAYQQPVFSRLLSPPQRRRDFDRLQSRTNRVAVVRNVVYDSDDVVQLDGDNNNTERKGTQAIQQQLGATTATTTLVHSVRSMRVKEIQQELKERKVAATGIFEKEDLVQLLVRARQQQQQPSSAQAIDASAAAAQAPQQHSESSSDVPLVAKQQSGDTSKQKEDSNANNHSIDDERSVIRTPLLFANMDPNNMHIQGASGGSDLFLEPSQQPYASIQIQVLPKQQQKLQQPYTLSLLLDTACSGLVLRPQIQSKYNLPLLQSPVTMTGAAGTSQGTAGITVLDQFVVAAPDSQSSQYNQQQQQQQQRFGPLPAAIQDVGALPPSLDGIIGNTFLNQFVCVEFDFEHRTMSFHRTKPPPERGDAVAQADLTMVGNLGIFAVDVCLGGRGPVSMLVDTGASCTLLNWRGVEALGASKESRQLSRIPNFGAMGIDSVAIQLTHRLHVSSSIQLGRPSSVNNGNGNDSAMPGLDLKGKRLAIDIGSIPVIDNLTKEGIGGILGIDVLMQCKAVRVSTRGPQRKITLYN
jgi:predicted aspartyl protease